MIFQTTLYALAHGSTPAASDVGTWGFAPADQATESAFHVFSEPMAYAEALRWAQAEPSLQGCERVAVLPF